MPTAIPTPRTLYDKIWDEHVVYGAHQSTGDSQLTGRLSITDGDGPSLLYIDRHLVHEVCPQAFDGLRSAGRQVRRPDCTLVTVDHNIPTVSRKNFTDIENFIEEPNSRAQCLAVEQNVIEFGLTYFGMGDRRQGIVHIIGPEQGFSLPGATIVCGDSHTSTHGAFGALAFGIGTSEVEHVLATQTILQQKSRNMLIAVDGVLGEGVMPKDVMLHIIGHIGTAGATGCVLQFAGSVFREMTMEGRMSVCNMSIEAGARAGLVEPDNTTFAYLEGRPFAPTGAAWDAAVAHWRTLRSDSGAKFDAEVHIRAEDIVPTVTWGTSPQDVVPITGVVPDPASFDDPIKRSGVQRALKYMGLQPNTRMEDITVDKVFIGSCTNSRIEDLRSAAKVVLTAGPGAHVASNVHAMVVPGSGIIKAQAEAEGLDAVFKRAGFDWREAGCSMCLGMNPDQLSPGQRCASTSNRNFEGRQGAGGRTHLVSPAMAAAAALTGKLTDVRKFMRQNAGAGGADAAKLTVTSPSDFLVERALPPPAPVMRKASTGAQNSNNGAGVTKFMTLKGIAAPLHMANVDTDLIIPKQFLKTLTRSGLGGALFFALREDPHTGQKTEFVLNRAPYDRAKILVVTGPNFACGSSREHAVWSLMDFGIRCVIAPSIADIHKNNELQNGMLPIELPLETCAELGKDAEEGLDLEVDLEKQEIRREQGRPTVRFEIDAFRRHCLLNGLDDIGLTMQKVGEIARFERWRTTERPWLDGIGYDGRVGERGSMEW